MHPKWGNTAWPDLRARRHAHDGRAGRYVGYGGVVLLSAEQYTGRRKKKRFHAYVSWLCWISLVHRRVLTGHRIYLDPYSCAVGGIQATFHHYWSS